MENLSIIENDLVPGVNTPYRLWIERRIGESEAVEGEDFEAVQICAPSG